MTIEIQFVFIVHGLISSDRSSSSTYTYVCVSVRRKIVKESNPYIYIQNKFVKPHSKSVSQDWICLQGTLDTRHKPRLQIGKLTQMSKYNEEKIITDSPEFWAFCLTEQVLILSFS